MVEQTVVLWATFFGLAVANAVRIAGHRFDLELLLTALLATVAINIVAASAKAIPSKAAFYAGLCGALVGFVATEPIYSPDSERRLNCYAYERTVTHGSARVGAGLCLGGITGVGLGYILSRGKRKT